MRRFMAFAWLAAVGCGGDEQEASSSVAVENVLPVGSIGGVVLDGATRTPLAGVSARAIVGAQVIDAAAATGKDGIFLLEAVPTGSALVILAPPDGYLAAEVRVDVPSAAGDFPLGNAAATVGPIGLAPIAAAPFRVQLVTTSGAPATGVATSLRTFVRYLDLETGVAVEGGEVVVAATTDGGGWLSFAGLPDFVLLGGGVDDTVVLTVPPYDGNGDGAFEFTGGEFVLSLLALGRYEPTIVLTDPATPGSLAVVGSTIGTLMGLPSGDRLVDIGETIYVLFNLPLDAGATTVDLRNEAGTSPVMNVASVDGSVVTIDLVGEGLGGAEFNLNLHAVARVGALSFESTLGTPFFTPPVSMSVTNPNLARESDPDAADIVRVTFAEPIGTGSVSNMNVVQFNTDLCGGDSFVPGDVPGERGNPAGLTLYIDEPEPPGAAGRSGYTTMWYFYTPTRSDCTSEVGPPFLVDLNFGLIGTPVTRVNGEIVEVGGQLGVFNLNMP